LRKWLVIKKTEFVFIPFVLPVGEKMYGLYVLPLSQRSAKQDMNVIEMEVARIWYSFNFKQTVVIAGAEVKTGELGATLALLVSSNDAR
jgi:hypothetical protein